MMYTDRRLDDKDCGFVVVRGLFLLNFLWLISSIPISSVEAATVPGDPLLLRKTAGGARAAGSHLAINQEIALEADLAISRSDSVDPVIAGNNLIYTTTVSNFGPSDANDVVVYDTLPSGVSLVSTTGCAEDDAGVPVCSLGTIAPSAQKQYLVVVSVGPGVAALATLDNLVEVSSSTPDPFEDNNADIETTFVVRQADLSLSKTDSVDPVTLGEELSYTITVENAGPSNADGVVVTDNLPAGVSLVSTSGCAEDGAGVPTCSLGTIAAGANAGFTVAVTVDPATGYGTTLTNNANVTSSTYDPDEVNNSTTEDTKVALQDEVILKDGFETL